MKIIAGRNTPERITDYFKSEGFEIFSAPAFSPLSSPVASHPDMLFFSHGGVLYLSREYYNLNKEFCDSLPARLCPIDYVPRAPYPDDIGFDCIYIENTLFCLEKHTPDEIKSLFGRVVNIKQGYGRCSALLLRDGVITADRTVASAVGSCGYDALLIKEDESILLPGYGCGFIGGASFVCGGSVYFTGDINGHPSAGDIISFCEKRGYAVKYPSGLPLFDCGSFKEI